LSNRTIAFLFFHHFVLSLKVSFLDHGRLLRSTTVTGYRQHHYLILLEKELTISTDARLLPTAISYLSAFFHAGTTDGEGKDLFLFVSH
jgi:hypothetical protein